MLWQQILYVIFGRLETLFCSRTCSVHCRCLPAKDIISLFWALLFCHCWRLIALDIDRRWRRLCLRFSFSGRRPWKYNRCQRFRTSLHDWDGDMLFRPTSSWKSFRSFFIAVAIEPESTLACGAYSPQETWGIAPTMDYNLPFADPSQIKDGWGWQKWDTDRWNTCKMSDPCREFLHERCVWTYLSTTQSLWHPQGALSGI